MDSAPNQVDDSLAGRLPARRRRMVLIVATLLGSWLGMQAVHECGHVLGAWLTGGRVARVVLYPLTFSRTDLADNPRPRAVAWAGPMVGATVPLLLWAMAGVARWPGAFVLRFFAGFCLLANGLYIAVGSLDRVGDCRELLQHGARPWELWLFGVLTAPLGLWLWHGLGRRFGLGPASEPIPNGVLYSTLAACLALVALGFAVGGS